MSLNTRRTKPRGEPCTGEVSDMAKNPPTDDGHRHGAVRDRSQVYNPKVDRWIKRDDDTGRFIDQKKDSDPFKGVRREKG